MCLLGGHRQAALLKAYQGYHHVVSRVWALRLTLMLLVSKFLMKNFRQSGNYVIIRALSLGLQNVSCNPFWVSYYTLVNVSGQHVCL